MGGSHKLIHRIAAFVSAFLWVIAIGGAIYLFFSDSLNSYPVELVYKEVCDENTKLCSEHPDAINIAVQLGRLDFVAMALTVLGVGVGLLAIFSFLYAKEKAEIEAKSAAKEVAEREMEELSAKAEKRIQLAIDDITAQAWKIVEEQLETHQEFMGFTGEITGELSNEIATRVEDDGNESK